MATRYLITVDAETAVIREGIRAVSEVRDDVQDREGIRIPLVWFVRFQRGWSESVAADSAAAVEGPLVRGFDGFALAHDELIELRARGDEIGWHYHAYNFVHRDDLGHATKLEILRADITSCAQELSRRHPDFHVETFRFGWFFVPDYAIYDTLRSVGITRDASMRASYAGHQVVDSELRYPDPLAAAPTRVNGLSLFPFTQTLIVHDWTFVPHELGWHRLDGPGAAARRQEFAAELGGVARRLRRDGGAFLTYETFPSSAIAPGPDA